MLLVGQPGRAEAVLQPVCQALVILIRLIEAIAWMTILDLIGGYFLEFHSSVPYNGHKGTEKNGFNAKDGCFL